MKGLRGLQRWFLDEVRRRSALPRPKRDVARIPSEAVVLPSPTLEPDERVAIYGRMYMARLEECLSSDYPVVKRLLGPGRFSRLARRYVTAHPPRSWTLNRLGEALPRFLEEEPRLPRAALVRDVARLERAMSEAFDAEDAPPLTPARLAALPPSRMAALRLTPAPSLRVLALETAASRAVTAVRESGDPPRSLPRRPTFVAVYSRDLRVWRLELTRPMHAALSSLARGRTLGAALGAAARVYEGDPALLPGYVRDWFATWIGEGLFAGVDARA